jgi:hypothetical protein
MPAISAGARKMPLPIIDPMMIMVASSSRKCFRVTLNLAPIFLYALCGRAAPR